MFALAFMTMMMRMMVALLVVASVDDYGGEDVDVDVSVSYFE